MYLEAIKVTESLVPHLSFPNRLVTAPDMPVVKIEFDGINYLTLDSSDQRHPIVESERECFELGTSMVRRVNLRGGPAYDITNKPSR